MEFKTANDIVGIFTIFLFLKNIQIDLRCVYRGGQNKMTKQTESDKEKKKMNRKKNEPKNLTESDIIHQNKLTQQTESDLEKRKKENEPKSLRESEIMHQDILCKLSSWSLLSLYF